MSKRISQREAAKRRKAYRDAHLFSWAPILGERGWRLSLKKPAIVHHIAGGRLVDEYERPENYFPISDFPVANEHMGWAHGLDAKAANPFWDETAAEPGQMKLKGYWQAQARIQCWALKLLAGETPAEVAEQLMRGRGLTWWLPTMGEDTSLEDVILSAAAVFAMDIKVFPCRKGVMLV